MLELDRLMGSIGSMVTHWTVYCGMLKWIFQQGWDYPFFSIVFLSSVLFVSSLILFGYEVRKRKKLSDSMFYLSGGCLFVLAIAYSVFLLSTAYSLFQINMTCGTYMLISLASDLLFIGILSSIVLKRSFSGFHWVGFLLCVGSCFIYCFITYEGQSQNNWGWSVPEINWRGPVFAIISRAAYVFIGVISKKMLMVKGYSHKLMAQRLKQKLQKPIKTSRRKTQPNLEPQEKFQQLEGLKNKNRLWISKNSMLYKRAQLQRTLNSFMIEEIDAQINNNNTNTNNINESPAPLPTHSPIQTQNPLSATRTQISAIEADAPFQPNTTQNEFRSTKFQEKIRDKEIINLIEAKNKLKSKIDQIPDLSANDKDKLLEQEIDKIENIFLQTELESLAKDYQNVDFHMHLFTGKDEIVLTKIDSIFDNVIYDAEIVGIDLQTTYQIHAIGGALALLPLAYIFSFFYGELPEAYEDMIMKRIDGPFGNGYTPLLTAIVFSVLFASRPYFQHKIIYSTDSFLFFSINTFSFFFLMMMTIIFIDTNENVPTTQGFAIMVAAFSYFFFYYGNASTKRRLELISSMECMKTILELSWNPDLVERIERQLTNIHNLLGIDTLYRVMLDCCLSSDPNALTYTSNPIMPIRALFDPDYYGRVSNWGGSYPRPFCEIVEETWKAKDGEGISVIKNIELEESYIAQQTDIQKKEAEEKIKISQKKLEITKKKEEQNQKNREQLLKLIEGNKKKISNKKTIFTSKHIPDEASFNLSDKPNQSEILSQLLDSEESVKTPQLPNLSIHSNISKIKLNQTPASIASKKKNAELEELFQTIVSSKTKNRDPDEESFNFSRLTKK